MNDWADDILDKNEALRDQIKRLKADNKQLRARVKELEAEKYPVLNPPQVRPDFHIDSDEFEG